MLCEYGCGRTAKYKLKFKKSEKWCCEKTRQKCPANKSTPWNKGKKNVYSDETLKKMSNKKIGVSLSQEHKTSLSKVRKGKKKSEEHKKNISLALIGKKKSKEHRDNISKSQRGIPRKKHSKETIEKMKKNQLGEKNSFYGMTHTKQSRLKMSKPGIKNPNWRGGISKEPYSFEFSELLKEEIKKRDGYKCVKCGSRKLLCIHHIDYNKKNCSRKNLITLCRSCHAKSNYKRSHWQKFYINIIQEIII